jgi:hypothetical protein
VQPGAWSNAPSSYTYQWQRLTDDWQDIDDATARHYTPSSDDLGRRLRVTVVALNDDGSASAGTAPTAPIGASGLHRAASDCRLAKASKTNKKAKKAKKARKITCAAKTSNKKAKTTTRKTKNRARG